MLEVANLIVTGLTGLLGVLLGSLSAVRVQAAASRAALELEHTRRRLDRDEREHRLVIRYQEPLVRAAYDLQARLWNILNQDYLEIYLDRADRPEGTYARESTVWLLAQYLGWVEIVRREAQFLPLKDQDAQGQVQKALDKVSKVLSTDHDPDAALRIFRPQQRAIGELMIVPGQDAEGGTRTDCMGFARFVQTLSHPTEPLSSWLAPVLSDVRPVDERTRSRLVAVQHELVGLVDAVDPDRARFSHSRERSP